MKYYEKQFKYKNIHIRLYQEPALIGFSIIYDRGDEMWGEPALLSIQFLIWEIDLEAL